MLSLQAVTVTNYKSTHDTITSINHSLLLRHDNVTVGEHDLCYLSQQQPCAYQDRKMYVAKLPTYTTVNEIPLLTQAKLLV